VGVARAAVFYFLPSYSCLIFEGFCQKKKKKQKQKTAKQIQVKPQNVYT